MVLTQDPAGNPIYNGSRTHWLHTGAHSLAQTDRSVVYIAEFAEKDTFPEFFSEWPDPRETAAENGTLRAYAECFIGQFALTADGEIELIPEDTDRTSRTYDP